MAGKKKPCCDVYEPAEEQFYKHNPEANKIARAALKVVARQLSTPYQKVIHGFINWDDFISDEVTLLFWREVRKAGYDFNRVDRCSHCGKFNMWKNPDEPYDLPPMSDCSSTRLV